MERNILAEDIERRTFRSAFDIAASMGIDLDGSIALARHLTGEAMRFARERADARAMMTPAQPAAGQSAATASASEL